MDHRDPPVFRLRDQLGPEFQPDYGRTLADQMHRRYDAIADEQVPPDLTNLVRQL
jgi:hypothetical protein